MFFVPFHEQIRSARRSGALTQQELADRCGMSRSRLVQLERNYRTPSASEKQVLSRLLRISSPPTRLPEALRRLWNRGKRMRGKVKPYFPQQDRMTYIRFRAALERHPQFVNTVLHHLRSRSDYVDLAFLCSKMSLDSYAEALFLLALLNADAEAAMLPISDLAWTPHQAVNPLTREEVNRRPQPCLLLDDKAFFFQVAFLTPRLYKVDVLVWSSGWSLLEIDAEGHDFSEDQERMLRLNLPFRRLKPSEIVAPGFVESLHGYLANLAGK